MHGLKTIKEINDLAANNAPGVAEKLLAEAEASREGRPSKFDQDYAAAKERQRIEREKAIANLSARSSEELISISRSVNGFPSTLETVLANRLEELIQANARKSAIPAVQTEDESGVVTPLESSVEGGYPIARKSHNPNDPFDVDYLNYDPKN